MKNGPGVPSGSGGSSCRRSSCAPDTNDPSPTREVCCHGGFTEGGFAGAGSLRCSEVLQRMPAALSSPVPARAVSSGWHTRQVTARTICLMVNGGSSSRPSCRTRGAGEHHLASRENPTNDCVRGPAEALNPLIAPARPATALCPASNLCVPAVEIGRHWQAASKPHGIGPRSATPQRAATPRSDMPSRSRRGLAILLKQRGGR